MAKCIRQHGTNIVKRVSNEEAILRVEKEKTHHYISKSAYQRRLEGDED